MWWCPLQQRGCLCLRPAFLTSSRYPEGCCLLHPGSRKMHSPGLDWALKGLFSLSPWFRPVQGCRNWRWPGLSLPLTNHFLPVTQTLQRWSTEIVYRNSVVGKCRDGEGRQKAEGAGGLNVGLLLASQPHSLVQAPWGERSAGRRGDGPPYAESTGPEVCEECEWYAWVDSFRARRGDGSCCHLLWTPQAHSNSVSGMGLPFFFFFS